MVLLADEQLEAVIPGAADAVTAKRHGFLPNYFVNPVMTIPGFGTITTRACAEA